MSELTKQQAQRLAARARGIGRKATVKGNAVTLFWADNNTVFETVETVERYAALLKVIAEERQRPD